MDDLKKLLDNIIAGNEQQARVSFHTYLSSKIKQLLPPKQVNEISNELAIKVSDKRMANMDKDVDHYHKTQKISDAKKAVKSMAKAVKSTTLLAKHLNRKKAQRLTKSVIDKAKR